MNDDLHSFEFELRRLRPRKPSEFLESRLEAALEKTPQKSSRLRAAWWLRTGAGVGLAAAVAHLSVLMQPVSPLGGAKSRALQGNNWPQPGCGPPVNAHN